MALYPSRMAPIGTKLWENAFQTILDISFFDINPKKMDAAFRKNRFFVCRSLVLEEQRFFERHRQIRRFLKLPAIFLFSRYDPWRRGKRVETFFLGSFGDENDQQKLEQTPRRGPPTYIELNT